MSERRRKGVKREMARGWIGGVMWRWVGVDDSMEWRERGFGAGEDVELERMWSWRGYGAGENVELERMWSWRGCGAGWVSAGCRCDQGVHRQWQTVAALSSIDERV